jgi:hypothetical protein
LLKSPDKSGSLFCSQHSIRLTISLAAAVLFPVHYVLADERKPVEVVELEIAKGAKMKFCWIPAVKRSSVRRNRNKAT